MTGQNAIVAVFDTHSKADAGILELQKSHFEMRNVSVMAREIRADDETAGHYTTAGRMKYWGRLQAFWNGIWDRLAGAGFFYIPGLGPLLVAGPVTNWIVIALENTPVFGGLSAPGGALYSMGIPKRDVLKCEFALKEAKYLIIAHGTPVEVGRARRILDATGTIDSGA